MTIAYVVTFSFTPEVEEHDVDTAARELRTIAGRHEGVLLYHCGRDLALAPGTADFAIVAIFASTDALSAYQSDPEHVAVVARLKPAVAARSAVQFEIDDVDAVQSESQSTVDEQQEGRAQ
ncbi:Dabb family protein [Desertimonas flava]|uniref:Dabb family protein n=1 Tax=Desertimonas flava TaxID=2064846 RepID=UPI000E34D60C|nr:Dabb family protein [Desertimonas flava]